MEGLCLEETARVLIEESVLQHNIRIEGHAQSGKQSVKVDECMLNMAEYEGLMEEVLTFFGKYKPPSHGYRPTLPLGYHFGKELLPRGQTCDSGDEDMDG